MGERPRPPVPPRRSALLVARTVIAIWLPPAPASESTSDKGDIGSWREIRGRGRRRARRNQPASISPSRRFAQPRSRLGAIREAGCGSAAKQSLRCEGRRTVCERRSEGASERRKCARRGEKTRRRQRRRRITVRSAPLESNW